MSTNSDKVIKSFEQPLNGFKEIQHIKHIYTVWEAMKEKKLSKQVKLTHLKRNSSQKPSNCSNTNFSLHFRGVLEKVTPQTYSIFRSFHYFSVTKITLILLLTDMKKPQKEWTDLKRERTNTIKFFDYWKK